MKRQVIPEIGEVTQKRVHFEEVGMLVHSYKARHNPRVASEKHKGVHALPAAEKASDRKQGECR